MHINKRSVKDFKMMNVSIWLLAWPAIIEFGLQTVVQYVDLLMVAGLGNQATVTVGIATQLQFFIKFPLSNMSIGVLAYISRAIGEKNLEKVRKASMQTVFISIFIGVIGTVIALGISPVLPVFLHVDSSIRDSFLKYYCISYSTLFMFTVGTMFSAVLRALGDMKTPMIVNGFINLLNILLNAIFIYPSSSVKLGGLVIRTFGLNMGVNGSALATAIAIGTGGIIMFLMVFKNESVAMRHKKLIPDYVIIRDILKISIPASFCSLVNGFGRLFFTSYVSGMGTIAMAAHAIALTVEGFFYIPAVGIQRAVSVFTGNFLGEKSSQKLVSTTKTTSLMGSSMMLVLGGILFLFANNLTSMFTKDPVVVLLSAKLLRIIAFSEPIFALSIIMEGVFQGIGNTKTPFWVSTFSMWLFRVCICYILTQQLSLGLTAVWICMISDNVFRALLLTWQFSLRKWKYLFN